ncbi:hypothetical protein [Halobellus captivus]|uniref:hypothetical protein n=1 Tax=Halobellus captivus TaxID=2592614 RepID=UPI0011A1DAA5|nr:hypothetical protein [Halobellus captivus]
MDATQLTLAVALVFVVAGLVGLLAAEAAGLSTVVVAACGMVALAGVGVLTAAVARVPEPAENDDHGV